MEVHEEGEKRERKERRLESQAAKGERRETEGKEVSAQDRLGASCSS